MKIDIDKAFVILQAENAMDLFNLGQLYSDMTYKNKLNPTITILADSGPPYGKMHIEKEEFIEYLIKKL